MNHTGNVEYNQYWGLENDVATSFNRLKGKLFNLIEATITDKVQCEATKGLIKGFANDEFKICVKNMRYSAEAIGLLQKVDIDGFLPESAEPLENRTF